jgi:protein-S-isoprenylcysteine O-methyltransferase Ste14
VGETRPVPTAAARAFSWAGAALFALSLGYFLYTYIVTFGETGPAFATSTWRAVAWNAALFGVFAMHHSVFARVRARAWMASHLPPGLERSVYVWIASLLLIAVSALWAPLPGVAWQMTGAWRWFMRVPLFVGIWLTLRSAGVIDIWDLAGVRQLETPNSQLPTPKRGTENQPAERGEGSWELEVGSWESQDAEFKTSGPYGLVRHPIYLGWILIVFSVPTMTMTRLAFATISCLYLVVAIPFEERTIIATAGDGYRDYMRRVRWRLIPGAW